VSTNITPQTGENITPQTGELQITNAL